MVFSNCEIPLDVNFCGGREKILFVLWLAPFSIEVVVDIYPDDGDRYQTSAPEMILNHLIATPISKRMVTMWVPTRPAEAAPALHLVRRTPPHPRTKLESEPEAESGQSKVQLRRNC